MLVKCELSKVPLYKRGGNCMYVTICISVFCGCRKFVCVGKDIPLSINDVAHLPRERCIVTIDKKDFLLDFVKFVKRCDPCLPDIIVLAYCPNLYDPDDYGMKYVDEKTFLEFCRKDPMWHVWQILANKDAEPDKKMLSLYDDGVSDKK